MKYVDCNAMPCPSCMEGEHEQLIVFGGFRLCEKCWHDWAHQGGLCRDCGETCESVKDIKCFECQADDYRDHMNNTRNFGSIY
jgi:hypothetical protein